MSESDGGPGRREVAHRLFAAEFDDADYEYSESDEERAPNYVVTPTGARVNRLFLVGVLTEVEPVSDGVLRARVVDPTGAFVCYAGQYQPDERAFLERADPPAFVAVTGKARTFQPDDADVVYTSVRPEAVNEVDAVTRDRWTLEAAKATVDRVRTVAGALALDQRGDALREVLEANDVATALASGIPIAFEQYGIEEAYLASLAEVALDAARLVAGEVDEIEATTLPPDAPADRSLPVEPRRFEVPEDLSRPSEPGSEAEADLAEAEPGRPGDETGAAPSDAAEPETADEPESEATEPSAERAGVPAETPPTEASGGEGAGTEAQAAPDDGGAGTDAAAEDVGDFDEGEFDLDEEKREEIEAEYGTDFQTGTEVDEPGEADMEATEPKPAGAGERGGGGPEEAVEGGPEEAVEGGP
ncbi:MAG: hypothetical protein V5A43_06060, partial [Haloarculaceae archaeon]